MRIMGFDQTRFKKKFRHLKPNNAREIKKDYKT